MSVPLHPPTPTEDPVRPQILDDMDKIFAQTKLFQASIIQEFKKLDTSKLEDVVKLSIMELIPIRSGRLLDTILNTLKVELVHNDRNSFYFDLTYTHALGRTDPVGPGRVKHGVIVVGHREFGKGEDYIPTHSIPNVKRVGVGGQIQNTTDYGNPLNVILYELDDPVAREEVMETMTNIYIAAFVIEFNRILDTMKLPSSIKIGGISGEISQSENMERFLKGGLS